MYVILAYLTYPKRC